MEKPLQFAVTVLGKRADFWRQTAIAGSSVRFGLGRFDTAEEIDRAIAALAESVTLLRKMSSLPMLDPDGLGRGRGKK